MKKMLTVGLIAASVLSGCTTRDSKTLRVKLDLEGFGDTVMIYGGPEKQQFVGKDGKFEFEVQVDTVYSALLYQPKLDRGEMDDLRFFSVPFVGGEEMRLWQTDPDRYDVDGTGFYADYHKADLFIEEAGKKSNELSRQLSEMKSGENVSEEEIQAFINDSLTPAKKEFFQAIADYVEANPKQEAIVPFLRYISNVDMLKETWALFDASVRQGRMKVLYDEWIKQFEESEKAAKEEEEAAKKQEAGLEAPDFTLTDINGTPLTLSSLRGKYVVLDFWGSWCVWCIKGFPQMKEYYAKYKGKFEILGIDCNDTEDKWKEAVKKHEVPWLHVYCPEDATVQADYGITGYPTKIIIGPDGKIVKTIVGEDPAFYSLLDDLFGK